MAGLLLGAPLPKGLSPSGIFTAPSRCYNIYHVLVAVPAQLCPSCAAPRDILTLPTSAYMLCACCSSCFGLLPLTGTGPDTGSNNMWVVPRGSVCERVVLLQLRGHAVALVVGGALVAILPRTVP